MAENALVDQSRTVSHLRNSVWTRLALWSLPKLKAYEIADAVLTGQGKESGHRDRPRVRAVRRRWARGLQGRAHACGVAAAQELAAKDRDLKIISAPLVRACSEKKCRVRATTVEAIRQGGGPHDPTLLKAIKPVSDDKSYHKV
jgi:hypothetical protein